VLVVLMVVGRRGGVRGGIGASLMSRKFVSVGIIQIVMRLRPDLDPHPFNPQKHWAHYRDEIFDRPFIDELANRYALYPHLPESARKLAVRKDLIADLQCRGTPIRQGAKSARVCCYYLGFRDRNACDARPTRVCYVWSRPRSDRGDCAGSGKESTPMKWTFLRLPLFPSRGAIIASAPRSTSYIRSQLGAASIPLHR